MFGSQDTNGQDDQKIKDRYDFEWDEKELDLPNDAKDNEGDEDASVDPSKEVFPRGPQDSDKDPKKKDEEVDEGVGNPPFVDPKSGKKSMICSMMMSFKYN